jgi:hypothetical protein
MRLGWHLPLDHLSATSLSAAALCPEQFRQKYLCDTPEPNFSGKFIGSVDHEMAAYMAEVRMNGAQPDELEKLYATAWETVLLKDGEPDWRDDDPTKMFKTGVRMAKLYWDQVLSRVEPVAAEQRIEFKIPEVPALIVGYVDLFERDRIRERKTKDRKVTTPEPKWRFQGLIYQYATGLPIQWDVVTRQVTPQLYTADVWPELFMPVRDPSIVRGMIVDVAQRMNDLYTRYGPDRPWPTTGVFHPWLCQYCSVGPRYQGTCTAWADLFDPER